MSSVPQHPVHGDRLKRISFVFVAALLLAVPSCHRDPVATGLTGAARVSVVKVEGGLRITNHTDRGIAYVITNPNWLGLMAICIDPGPGCIRIAPGQSVVAPFTEIGGYEPGVARVSVAWWHVLPDGEGQYKAEEPFHILIEI